MYSFSLEKFGSKASSTLLARVLKSKPQKKRKTEEFSKPIVFERV
ncbi:hypothetical protein LEP1GSC052_0825 [Leptospira kmetyi serovar Malaysia str. Bejo-Iso9]|nr:hypothetical protein LEP1GSC052_0825 [Leptospira kmetyi serovar Malaysia str. Bejo-Iso9]